MFEGKKIAIGYEIRNGPWGGGNQFLISFKDYFEKRGAKIVHRLSDKDLSLIILINPRKGSGTFDHKDIERYKRFNPKVKVIHRINETDKAKNTNNIDRLRLKANKVVDAVVFVSEWVRDYYIEKGFDPTFPHTVIRSGPDEKIFNPEGYIPWKRGIPLKIVTHHWSDNYMKGTDIYQYLDELLDDEWMRRFFEFTYIGRLPNGIKFKNTRYVPVLQGKSLAEELRKHHVYLTAARWESCSMHQLEGACCGLPLLFIDEGGGAVECSIGFGIQFSKSTFILNLFKILEKYAELQPKMKEFPLNASATNKKYEELIEKLLENRIN
jgi:glycosyltransferase involved in cell wall biosynthesis